MDFGLFWLSFCHRYFSLQATHPLGFDDVVRLEIESNICREGGPLPNCFTTPLRQAWTTMEKVMGPRKRSTATSPNVGCGKARCPRAVEAEALGQGV